MPLRCQVQNQCQHPMSCSEYNNAMWFVDELIKQCQVLPSHCFPYFIFVNRQHMAAISSRLQRSKGGKRKPFTNSKASLLIASCKYINLVSDYHRLYVWQQNLDLVKDYLCQAAMCVLTKPSIGLLCAPWPISKMKIFRPQLK